LKLSRAETAAIVITLIFLIFTAVYVLHADRSEVAVTVSVGRMAETTGSPVLSGMETEPSVSALVNLNMADKKALDTLPGIGESLAEAIIAYRTENGAFQTTADLMRVSGIGAKTYEGLKDLITVG
jgi:competence protein ComEA